MDLGDLVVRRYVSSDAESLHESVTTSIEHLRPWMPWISGEPLGVDDRRALIDQWTTDWDERSDFTMGVFVGDRVVGGTGLHPRSGPGSLDIGYWLHVDCIGRGIMNRVVSALVESAFKLEDIVTVAISHDEANTASRRVAERAGFRLDGRYERVPEAPAETGTTLRWVRTRER